VTMYDGGIVLLMSLGGGGILHDPLLLSVTVWWGHTRCLMELALSYVSFSHGVVVVWSYMFPWWDFPR